MISQILIVAQTITAVTAASWMLGGNIYWAPPWIIFLTFLALLPLGWRIFEAPGETLRRLAPAIPWFLLSAVLLGSLLNPSFIMEVQDGEIIYRETAYIAWLPTVVTAEVARENVLLLIGFLLQATAVYVVLHRRRAIRLLLVLLLVNATALATTGAYFDLRGATEILGHFTPPVRQYFFSSFIYHNHWSAFAVLALGTGMGLFFSALRQRDRLDRRGSPALFYALCVALLAISLPMSTSRSGVILLFLLLLGFGFQLGRYLRQQKRKNSLPWRRVLPLYAGGFALFLGIFVALNHYYLERGWYKTETQIRQAEEAGAWQDFRLMAGADTFRMGLDRPAWGWGRGSFPYVFPLYQRAEISTTGDGQALFFEHAHNDWAEWFAELGLIGMILLLIPVLLRMRAFLRGSRQSILASWILSGMGLILIYALVEFPFGNPAVTLFFFVLGAAAFRYSELREPGRKAGKPSETPG